MSPNSINAAHELFRVLETQDAEKAVRFVASESHNVTAAASPVACQRPGPSGILASSAWLRFAFPDLSFEVEQSAVADGTDDVVWLRLRMKGTHRGAFVRFEDGDPAQVIPPTNRRIDVEQIHLVTVREGRVIWHDAIRDDLAMLGQLGVFPPTSAALKMAAWKATGRATRAARQVSAAAASAADTLTDAVSAPSEKA